MGNTLDEPLQDGIVNVNTDTLHKRKRGTSGFHTDCGVTRHLRQEQLRNTSVEQEIASNEISRCGRCFSDAGGY